MKRVLIVFPDLNSGKGPAAALVNFLGVLPRDGFAYDLLLTSSYDARFAKCWDRLPGWVNILPPLSQLDKFSEGLMRGLRSRGLAYMAGIREKVRAWNVSEGVDLARNWEELKKTVPEYQGYDIAIAYTEDIALQIVTDRVTAARKIGWVHTDYQMTWDAASIAMKRRLWEAMDLIACVSRQNLRSFSSCYPDLTERLRVIYNPCDVPFIRSRAGEFYPKEYENCNSPKIFTAGTVGTRKGTDLIIAAAKELVSEGHDIRWFIAGAIGAGKNHNGAECARMLKEYGMEDHVILLGYVDNPYPYFKHCDVYAHTSRYEGLSVAIQEAKALCKPILVTNHSSASEVIENGATGLICEIQAEDIARKLKALLNDKALRDALSSNLERETADAGGSADSVGDILRSLC